MRFRILPRLAVLLPVRVAAAEDAVMRAHATLAVRP